VSWNGREFVMATEHISMIRSILDVFFGDVVIADFGYIFNDLPLGFG
jgi:hypothetical protein